MEIAQQTEGVTEQVASVGEFLNEGRAVVRQSFYIFHVVMEEVAVVAFLIQPVALAVPHVALAVGSAAHKVYQCVVIYVPGYRPTGRTIDDALMGGAEPDAALPVFDGRGIACAEP